MEERYVILLLLLSINFATSQDYVSISGNNFYLNNEKIFLSGMNIAWHHYGMDFGNGRYDCCTGSTLEDYVDRIADNGGSSIRIWLHCVGRNTPAFDGNGYVTGPDSSGTMVNDLSRFLDKARSRNIAVVIVLWNGAQAPEQNLKNLIWDTSKLESYIDNALIPMVSALSGKQALAAWEIMNEPEGILRKDTSHDNECFDTTPLSGSGAGWVGTSVPMEHLLRFVNHQSAAIKRADSKALVTVGSWNQRAQNDAFTGSFNYYKDECLTQAGGYSTGIIDFYQMHTYTHNGVWSDDSPFKQKGTAYKLDKPLVIGEFSQDGSEWGDITRQFNHAYYESYQGAWSWQANGGGKHSDSFETQARGTNHLKGRNEQDKGGRVNFVFQ